MKDKFWHKQWQDTSPGFHQKKINPYLKKFSQELWGSLKHKKIFVPLCGKSSDMVWLLSKGVEVFGCELSEVACRDFFLENKIQFKKEKQEDFILFSGQSIHIFCGDFFKLSQQELEKLDGIYDRAALIALPEGMRKSYVAKVCDLNPENILLISPEYAGGGDGYPPFSVSEKEVLDLYSANFKVEKKADRAGFKVPKRLAEAGASDAREKVYFLKRI
jgi:thiopurine S-methyltransferase